GLPQTDATDEQDAEHRRRCENDARARGTDQRDERRADRSAEEAAGMAQRLQRVGPRTSTGEVQDAGKREQEQPDAEPDPQVVRFFVGAVREEQDRHPDERERDEQASPPEQRAADVSIAWPTGPAPLAKLPRAATTPKTSKASASASVRWPPSWVPSREPK